MAGTLTTQTVVYHSVSVYNYLYPIFRFCADTFCRLMSFSGVIVCALGVNVAENLTLKIHHEAPSLWKRNMG
ncbi:hypothetical protein B188_01240 [Candidatus Brocadiaceae bacterium B188]|nr:hypothetical protein [Candidatus Brocadia sapporoensis]QQR67379.1 MAG: hypothetical protein IPI25_03930 [Candidatus Brocadia sp.]RZV57166.1 MAG: hypothetical protein EX330_10850 [Candidatus Brocadia sp. BROELEC01]TWU52177.1 hypothetical protein B188_01240 [Candidatus Brocadiaceae bacterium B188]